MKVAIVCKSDTTGGAAVVSFRLMNALRGQGIDARMVVSEKLSDSPFVIRAASDLSLKIPFIAERLGIFFRNGLNRENLFKIDTGEFGVNLLSVPFVKEADVVCLNWVNQGFLSLNGVENILKEGKPVIWTMHDMWNFTGVCHHAGVCTRFRGECGNCPLLGKKANPQDMSHRIWLKKNKLYRNQYNANLQFVAVSRWLAAKAEESSLFEGFEGSGRLHVIPNAFPFTAERGESKRGRTNNISLLFGAARIDDPIKGLPVLKLATHVLAEDFPDVASRLELHTFGGVKYPDSLKDFGIRHIHHGVVRGAENVRKLYESSDVLVSTSLYETLPGTLVEAQAYGAIPVAFNRGGQSDIVNHLSTGYLAEWSDNYPTAARNIAEGIVRAVEMSENDSEVRDRMYESALSRFSEKAVAERYISMFEKVTGKKSK